MSLPCEHCNKQFPSNTSLYKHKRVAHREPTLVLVNHKNGMSTEHRHLKRKRPSDDNAGGKGKTRVPHPRLDDSLTVVDDSSPPQPNTLGDGIVDYVRPTPDPQADRGMVVIDDDRDSTRDVADYKKLFLECLKNHNDLREKYNKDVVEAEGKFLDFKKNLEEDCQRQLRTLKDHYEIEMLENGEKLQAQYATIITNLKQKHDKELTELRENHRMDLAKHEKDCLDKIKMLKDQIEAMEDDDEASGALSKAIYNCTSMGEIFEILRLVNNHQMDEVVERYLPTLQNLFLSLSMGILPICDPQRKQVSDEQRRIVDKVQTASKPTAKRLLREKQGEVVNLFTIVKDSLKMARDTYNRYGF